MKYPIEVTIKDRSIEVTKKLDKDDLVRCYFCNSVFPVKYHAFILDKYENKALRCPECRKIASVFYYVDRIVRKVKR